MISSLFCGFTFKVLLSRTNTCTKDFRQITRTKSQPSRLSSRNTSPQRYEPTPRTTSPYYFESSLRAVSPHYFESTLRTTSPQYFESRPASPLRNTLSQPKKPDLKSVTHTIEVVQSVGKYAKNSGKDGPKEYDYNGSFNKRLGQFDGKDKPTVKDSPQLRPRFRSSDDKELQDTIKQLDSLEFSWLEPETLSRHFAPHKPARAQQSPRPEPAPAEPTRAKTDDIEVAEPASLTRNGPVRKSWRDKFRRNLASYMPSTSESEDNAPRRVGRFGKKNPGKSPEIVDKVIQQDRQDTIPPDKLGPELTIKPILIYTNVCKIVL